MVSHAVSAGSRERQLPLNLLVNLVCKKKFALTLYSVISFATINF
jgi:hypothetical protein